MKNNAEPTYLLQLYVTGASPNSERAIHNLREICDTWLKGRFALEVIDVYQQPEVAKQEQLVALPLLIKRLPLPQRRLIGDLSDTAKVLKSLGINQ